MQRPNVEQKLDFRMERFRVEPEKTTACASRRPRSRRITVLPVARFH